MKELTTQTSSVLLKPKMYILIMCTLKIKKKNNKKSVKGVHYTKLKP